MSRRTCSRSTRPWIRPITRTAVTALSTVLLLCGLRAAAPSAKAAPATPASSGPSLIWHGGPVQHFPRVYLIFWGSGWQSDADEIATKAQIEALFNSLAGGQYNNILAQYGDNPRNPGAFVHNDVWVAGEWVDPTGPASGSAISTTDAKREIRVALLANPCDDTPAGVAAWCVSPDAQFIVLPQRGTAYGGDLAGSCGRHSAFMRTAYPNTTWVIYSVARYSALYADAACPDMLGTVTHEYAETATDPRPDEPAWMTAVAISRQRGNLEVGDLCEALGVQTYATTGGITGWQTFPVAPLWDDETHGCALARGQELWSPTTGKHTLDGALLSAYAASDPTGQGGPGGPLGYPTSEAYSVAGGQQADFQYGTLRYNRASAQTTLTITGDQTPICPTAGLRSC